MSARRNFGINLPQQLGRRLWWPKILMGIMAFLVTFILAAIRGNLISGGAATTSDASTIAVLGQLVQAAQFIGFMGILPIIAFAITGTLGAFHKGCRGAQESTGQRMLTLVVPYIARVVLALMMVGMLVHLFTVVTNFVLVFIVGDTLLGGGEAMVRAVTSWTTWLEGLRRIGAVVYFLSISLGLATGVTAIWLQPRRVRELTDEEALAA